MTLMIRRLADGCAIASGALLAIVVLLTVVNAVGFAANTGVQMFGGNVSGLPGYEDAVSLAVGSAALLMLPYCQLTRGHVSVDLFTERLSASTAARIMRATDALMGICAAFLGLMLAIGSRSYFDDGALSPVLAWPIWPFVVPGIAAVGLWSFTALAMAIDPDVALDHRHAERTEEEIATEVPSRGQG